MSAKDRDRTVAALGKAFLAGRLDPDEYTRRVGSAVAAVHYHDLRPLTADLPGRGTPGGRVPRRPLPTALAVLWRVWLAVAAVSVVVSALVALDRGGPPHPWPLWILVPPGTVLTVLTSIVSRRRRTDRPYPRSRRRRYRRRRPVRRSVRLPK